MKFSIEISKEFWSEAFPSKSVNRLILSIYRFHHQSMRIYMVLRRVNEIRQEDSLLPVSGNE